MITELRIWVIEYSYGQEAFSVRALEDSVSDNLQALLLREPRDYVIVAFARTHEAATELRTALDCRADRSGPFAEEDIRHIAEEVQRLVPARMYSPLDLL